jgi:hypothetical protein
MQICDGSYWKFFAPGTTHTLTPGRKIPNIRISSGITQSLQANSGMALKCATTDSFQIRVYSPFMIIIFTPHPTSAIKAVLTEYSFHITVHHLVKTVTVIFMLKPFQFIYRVIQKKYTHSKIYFTSTIEHMATCYI